MGLIRGNTSLLIHSISFLNLFLTEFHFSHWNFLCIMGGRRLDKFTPTLTGPLLKHGEQRKSVSLTQHGQHHHSRIIRIGVQFRQSRFSFIKFRTLVIISIPYQIQPPKSENRAKARASQKPILHLPKPVLHQSLHPFLPYFGQHPHNNQLHNAKHEMLIHVRVTQHV